MIFLFYLLRIQAQKHFVSNLILLACQILLLIDYNGQVRYSIAFITDEKIIVNNAYRMIEALRIERTKSQITNYSSR